MITGGLFFRNPSRLFTFVYLLDPFLNMVVSFGILYSNAISVKLSLYSVSSPSVSKDFIVNITHVDLTDWV